MSKSKKKKRPAVKPAVRPVGAVELEKRSGKRKKPLWLRVTGTLLAGLVPLAIYILILTGTGIGFSETDLYGIFGCLGLGVVVFLAVVGRPWTLRDDERETPAFMETRRVMRGIAVGSAVLICLSALLWYPAFADFRNGTRANAWLLPQMMLAVPLIQYFLKFRGAVIVRRETNTLWAKPTAEGFRDWLWYETLHLSVPMNGMYVANKIFTVLFAAAAGLTFFLGWYDPFVPALRVLSALVYLMSAVLYVWGAADINRQLTGWYITWKEDMKRQWSSPLEWAVMLVVLAACAAVHMGWVH